MKIVQISDTHLTHRGGATQATFEQLVAYVNEELRPDLVVHTGDIVILDPDVAEDRAAAHALVQTFDAPVRVVPGNHDVGEPGAHPWKGIAVTDARVAAYEATWGPGHWRHDVDGWTLLGLNSELLGSGLEREAAQWAWLEQTVDELGPDRPVLVFLHKPAWRALDTDTEHQVDIGEGPRPRLFALLERVALRGVGSGHLHRYHAGHRGDAVEVWAPTTAFVAGGEQTLAPDADPTAPIVTARQELGVVEWVCTGDAVEVAFRAPANMPLHGYSDVPELGVAWAEIDAKVDAGAGAS